MNKEYLMKVLLAPVITEKATMAGEQNNQYVFEVLPGAAKPEIKAAVEEMFDVKVDSVTVTNVKGKTKRFGASPGRRKSWRKAYVRLRPGNEIDFAGGD